MMKYIQIIYETLLVNYYLKKYEFGYITELYGSKYGQLNQEGDMEKEKLTRLLNKIDKVCFWFFGNAQCLHRSLIGFKLVRKWGIPAELVIGVKKFPFGSHAWLEHDGSVVNDIQTVKESYIEVLRIGGQK
ncbi:lasso peptide biosynthesis B2 protein [Bacillus albus]|uniref:lasso peptide biosynthesis B2 protein n=1 Tax=Bacillus albus TaxID=2026189 RepID=UPI003D1C545E